MATKKTRAEAGKERRDKRLDEEKGSADAEVVEATDPPEPDPEPGAVVAKLTLSGE